MGDPSNGFKFNFLHGVLQEEIYVKQPPNYVQSETNLVCHLKKFVYGLMQAPRVYMKKWIYFFLTLVFLDVILILISTPVKYEVISISLFFMLMAYPH